LEIAESGHGYCELWQLQMSMYSESWESSSESPEIEVTLDGRPVALPEERRSMASIRSFLEVLALDQQRILCSMAVDGKPVDLSQPPAAGTRFARIEAETMDLEQIPLQLVRTATDQTLHARAQVVSAVALVLINGRRLARELWWNLAQELKRPLLTLSLLPDGICGPPNGRASLMQLRKWQLQQLAAIIRDVDEACGSDDTAALSNALEYRVLPWLEGLETSLELWQLTLLAKQQAACQPPCPTPKIS
jgi:hypothetical protein